MNPFPVCVWTGYLFWSSTKPFILCKHTHTLYAQNDIGSWERENGDSNPLKKDNKAWEECERCLLSAWSLPPPPPHTLSIFLHHCNLIKVMKLSLVGTVVKYYWKVSSNDNFLMCLGKVTTRFRCECVNVRFMFLGYFVTFMLVLEMLV